MAGMIDYRIVYNSTSSLLEEDVMAYLNAGWKLQGGPYSSKEYVTNNGYEIRELTHTVHYQAITREIE